MNRRGRVEIGHFRGADGGIASEKFTRRGGYVEPATPGGCTSGRRGEAANLPFEEMAKRT
jgi:hypothetical protein